MVRASLTPREPSLASAQPRAARRAAHGGCALEKALEKVLRKSGSGEDKLCEEGGPCWKVPHNIFLVF